VTTSTNPATSATTPDPGTAATAAAKPVDERSPEQIEADLVATRQRLAGRIDDLQQYVAPRAVAGRGLNKVKRIYVDEYGGIRPERVVATVAVVAVLIGLRALRRRSR
jgi:hypothetical protein